MTENKFKVCFSDNNPILVVLGYLSLFIILMAIIIYVGSNYIFSIVFGIYLAILLLAITLPSILFYVNVKGSKISVRTRFGRRYKFNCLDIMKVNVTKQYSTRSGHRYRIIITTKIEKLDLEWSMINFEKMALYILEKFDSGEIIESAVSPHCKKELSRLSKKRGAYIE